MRRTLLTLALVFSAGCALAQYARTLRLTEDDGPVAEVHWPHEGFAIVMSSADPQRPPTISRRGRGACHFMPGADPAYIHDASIRFAATDPGVYSVRLLSTVTGASRLVAEGTIAVDRADDAVCNLFFTPRQHATFDLIEVVRIELTCPPTEGACTTTNSYPIEGSIEVREAGVNRRTDPVPNRTGLFQSFVLP